MIRRDQCDNRVSLDVAIVSRMVSNDSSDHQFCLSIDNGARFVNGPNDKFVTFGNDQFCNNDDVKPEVFNFRKC
jgi:hypothetical protein